MQNKSALELTNTYNLQVEVDKMEINLGSTFPPYKIAHPRIQIIRLYPYDMSGNQYLTYFNEIANAEAAVVVPKDFLFKILDKDDAQVIEQKYNAFVLKNLEHNLKFAGMVGSDPEIFAENEDGSIFPAFNFLPSKENPVGYNWQTNTNNLYWDGFQAEFTTNANHCLDLHAQSIKHGLKGIYNELMKHNPKAKLSTQTVFEIPFDLLRGSKPEHVAFGCMKSLNAYDMQGIQADGQDVFYRTAGGHIHFGFDGHATSPKSPEAIVRMVKALDAILGVASVSLFAKFDNPMRRQMYGLAGEYRLPPHGLEYRTLSNSWLFHPLMTHIVFDLARTAAAFGDRDLLSNWKADEKEVIEVVNSANVDGAREILKRNKTLFVQLLNVRYHSVERSEFVYDIIMNGMESIVKDPQDIAGNWELMGESFPNYKNPYGKRVRSCFTIDANGKTMKTIKKA